MDIKQLFDYKNWVVVGDVANSNKYAYKILKKFKNANYNVTGIDPRGKNIEIFKSLNQVPYKIEAIDLCINPTLGINVVKEANELRIRKILIQPGAESDEILKYCKENGMIAVEGCALVQLS